MYTIILTTVPPGTEIPVSSGSNWDVYLFFGILALCVVIFIYFLKKTDKLVDKEIEKNAAELTKNAHHKELNDEGAAAIALAIHLYKSELHDMESLTITLQKVSRIYSPWSSKIYGIRQHPRF
jgi:glutaconyl-CoA/methylmalonyl-CoA decarboxylase subunit delta